MTLPDREWIGARYKYPGLFRDAGENIQPDIVIWMEIPSRMIVSTTLIDPRKPVSFADSFEEAIGPRKNLALPRPASIRVPDDRLAKELRRVAGGTPIIVAPVPELDAAFAELTEMAGGDAQPSVKKRREVVIAEEDRAVADPALRQHDERFPDLTRTRRLFKRRDVALSQAVIDDRNDRL